MTSRLWRARTRHLRGDGATAGRYTIVPMPRRTDAEMNDLIRQNLIRFREELGITQTAAAEEAGVPLDNLRRYEKGKNRVDAVTLSRLAETYGRTVDDFHSEAPGPPDLSRRPVYYLRVAQGQRVTPETHLQLLAIIDKANESERALQGPAPVAKAADGARHRRSPSSGGLREKSARKRK